MDEQDKALTEPSDKEIKPQKGLLAHLQKLQAPASSDSEPAKTTFKLTPDDIQRAARVTALLVDEPAPPIDEFTTTLVLKNEARHQIPQTGNLYGYEGKAERYIPLPAKAIDNPLVLLAFRIELHELRSSATPIGIEVLGDVVLGLDRDDDQKPDFDLRPYGGHMNGVSRRHALIRPATHRLYLIDLQSTNGTMHNALPIISGHARELHDGDIITLGSLSFTVRIVGVGGPTM